MDLLSLPLDVLNPVRSPVAGAAAAVVPERIKKVAQDFEAAFLSAILQPMFNSLSTDAPFGGGSGEAAFKSFMVDAIAKQTAKRGGVGLSDAVTRELMRMQGAEAAPTPAAPAAEEAKA